MTSLKVLSIIGIVIAAFAFLAICAFQYTDYTAAIGWGVISTVYLLVVSIVGLVKANKVLNK